MWKCCIDIDICIPGVVELGEMPQISLQEATFYQWLYRAENFMRFLYRVKWAKFLYLYREGEILLISVKLKRYCIGGSILPIFISK